MVWKWNGSYDDDENIDWLAIRNGPVVKYFSKELLNKDSDELFKIGYQVIEVSTKNWTENNVHKKIQEGFGFPDYYGENINAFKDCLTDKFNKRHKGLVIVLSHFDSFYFKNKDFCVSLLDAMFSVAWSWLLAGQKLIVFVQSDNPDLEMERIGGFIPDWNAEEWLNEKRQN